MLRRIVLLILLPLLVGTAGCRERAAPTAEIDRIHIVGHGIAFDANMRPITMDAKTIASMQASLRHVLSRTKAAEDAQLASFSKRAEAAIAQAQSDEERALLTGALIHRQLRATDKQMRLQYAWRNRFLMERSRALLERRLTRRLALSERVQQMLREAGLVTVARLDTAYMNECRTQDVPVPPDFSLSNPGEWVHQGDLTYNILQPRQSAAVWTWTDPARRGACVALPRGGGGVGSLTGIICQSARTGRACFWDNIPRDDPTARIPVATETMVIRQIQDGRTLDEGAPCTGCHTGNNVFLMAPDDPTWARLMRGPLLGSQPTPRTFTTVVEPLTDSPGATRYTPIAHASWVNPALISGCTGACHGQPNAEVSGLWQSGDPFAAMPPACAAGGYRNCYRENP